MGKASPKRPEYVGSLLSDCAACAAARFLLDVSRVS